MLTFDIPHIFKALQMLQQYRFVSRRTFCDGLGLGEGAIRTMILRFKTHMIAKSTRSGTCLTDRGLSLAKSLTDMLPRETSVRSEILGNLHGHAILMRDSASVIRTGLEQRDFAVMYGASVALTLTFHDGHFSFPGEQRYAQELDQNMHRTLGSLEPQENDAVIITSAGDPFVAEYAAKNSALRTLYYRT